MHIYWYIILKKKIQFSHLHCESSSCQRVDGHKCSRLTEGPQRHQTKLSSARQQSRAPGTLSGAGGSAAQRGDGWQLLLGLVLCVRGQQSIWKVQVQMLICLDVLLCFLLPPTNTEEEMILNSNPHRERTPQHKLPNQKFRNQQMSYIVFSLLLHFLYLCYHINCFVTSHVSKDTYFVQHTRQGINL